MQRRRSAPLPTRSGRSPATAARPPGRGRACTCRRTRAPAAPAAAAAAGTAAAAPACRRMRCARRSCPAGFSMLLCQRPTVQPAVGPAFASSSAVQDGTATSGNRLAVALPTVTTSLHLRLVLRRVYRWRLWRRLLRLRRQSGRREERRLLLRCRLRRPRLRLAIACGKANRSRRLVRLAGRIAVGRHCQHTAC